MMDHGQEIVLTSNNIFVGVNFVKVNLGTMEATLLKTADSAAK